MSIGNWIDYGLTNEAGAMKHFVWTELLALNQAANELDISHLPPVVISGGPSGEKLGAGC